MIIILIIIIIIVIVIIVIVIIIIIRASGIYSNFINPVLDYFIIFRLFGGRILKKNHWPRTSSHCILETSALGDH